MEKVEVDGYEIEIDVHRIEMSDNLYSYFRGWMSPSGELVPLYGVDGHTGLAKEILNYKGDKPIEALQDAGWIRVVCENSYSCAILDDNTRHLILGMVLKHPYTRDFFLEVGRKSYKIPRKKAREMLTLTLE